MCFFPPHRRELAIQLQRDVLKPLDEGGIKLFLVTIGPAPRGFEFAELTGFPADRLLADPDSVTYEALGLYKSVKSTFLQQAVTPPPRGSPLPSRIRVLALFLLQPLGLGYTKSPWAVPRAVQIALGLYKEPLGLGCTKSPWAVQRA